MHQFSLFEGDLLNRAFHFFGIGSRGFVSLAARISLLWFLTFLPAAFLAYSAGYCGDAPRTMNFFGDLAVWGQTLIGLPLFIFAEPVIGKKTRAAAKNFLQSGVVEQKDLEKIHVYHERLYKLRQWLLPELLMLLAGFLFAAFWLQEEIHNSYDTWHAIGAPAIQTPTAPGAWAALIGIPIFNYLWLRWLWKASLWTWYLYKISSIRLRLIASHPDLTGGLSFLSEAQTSWAIIVFAFGIGVIAPLVGYKLEVEHAEILSFAVGGPLFGFIVGAPVLFTVPLLLFTKQLRRTKGRAVSAYQQKGTEAALFFEEKWLTACHDNECDSLLSEHLQGMKNLNVAYAHIKQMRVVPFDTRSFVELFGSTLGSLLPLLPRIVEIPEPVLKLLEVGKDIISK